MSPTEGARAGIQAYVDAYRTDEPRRYMTAFLNSEEMRPQSSPVIRGRWQRLTLTEGESDAAAFSRFRS